ncbi:MAG TPA: lysophospholipid acyltransferase family protein [Bacillota bacterium]|nr:lysophospholipid acyltransferase family protein [Bacillota bacterium]
MSRQPCLKKLALFCQNCFFQIFFFLVRICPLRTGLFFGRLLGLTAYSILKSRRNITLSNIEHAKIQGFLKKAPDSRKLARAVWKHLGYLGSEFLYYYSHDHRHLLQRVTIEGEEHLQSVLAKQKGAIMASAHIGNWELIGLCLSVKGYKLCPLVKPQENPFFNRLITAKRESVGMKTISRNGFLRPILQALTRNEIVPFIMDQTDFLGVKLDFFGRPAYLPAGPAQFAIKTGTPLIFVHIVRESLLSHKIIISEEIIPASTGDTASDIRETTKILAKIIERTIDDQPEQWLWMHKLWKMPKTAEPHSTE